MTDADGSDDSGARPGWRWDVALSFAGAQRDYVDQVAQALRPLGVRCFYDADEQIDLWGRYLAEELPAIYSEQAAAVVVFVSAEYAARDWARLERRAALNRAVRERREYVLPARFDDTPLPGLLSDMVAIDLRGRTAQQFAAVIAAKLARLAITAPAPPADAGGLARDVEPAPPAGAVRAGDADPRRLGVHAAISVPGVQDEVPPEYVLRDADAEEHGIRAKVAAAAQRGGLVLLVGGSSVGKTRSAVEAVKALLPEWWLVHPADPGEIAALAHAPVPRMVVWLDELQRYLDGDDGLTGAVVRALLNAPHPAVIIGTIWPDRYTTYTALPARSGDDPHAREREVLDLAEVVRIGPQFSPAEQDRARSAAERDRRLRVALNTAGYGLTQTLAAAPQLVARWENAETGAPYAWAVLTAALDLTRLGARAPLGADLLRAAAPGYCTSQQQAEAPGNWFEQAMAYATRKLHGAAAALSPTGAGMGHIAGYTAADYLLQHAVQERRYARVPADTWDAVISHIHDPADAARLAHSASNRLLYHCAIPLYRHAAHAGDPWATSHLNELLAERGDVEGLRTLANAGDSGAAWRLAVLLAKHEDVEGLRALANTGDSYAAWRLAVLLATHGDVEGLRARADIGGFHEAGLLADLLAKRGDVEGLRARAAVGDCSAAIQLAELLAKHGDVEGLRTRANTGDSSAATQLAELLAKHGDVEGLRTRANTGDSYAATQLAELLAKHGDLNEAKQILRALADTGDLSAASRLADLLAEHGDVEELRTLADTGDLSAASRLADLLAERGDVEGLRTLANAGGLHEARLLADLLAERGDVEGLRTLANSGDLSAASRLPELLAERGDVEGLRTLADTGGLLEAGLLADLLAERGDVEGLRTRADVGDSGAAWRLAVLLATHGDVEELGALADAGDSSAATQLAELLAKRGDVEGLRTRADAGDSSAATQLAELLAERGDLNEAKQILRALADSGDSGAARRLPGLLAEHGDVEGLRTLANAGDLSAARRLPGLLAEHGDVEGLRTLANAGVSSRAWRLAELLAVAMIKQGRVGEAKRLRRFGLNPDGSIACA